MVSNHRIDMDSLADMGSSHHKVMVNHPATRHPVVDMELLLMARHLVMVYLANSLVCVSRYCL